MDVDFSDAKFRNVAISVQLVWNSRTPDSVSIIPTNIALYFLFCLLSEIQSSMFIVPQVFYIFCV